MFDVVWGSNNRGRPHLRAARFQKNSPNICTKITLPQPCPKRKNLIRNFGAQNNFLYFFWLMAVFFYHTLCAAISARGPGSNGSASLGSSSRRNTTCARKIQLQKKYSANAGTPKKGAFCCTVYFFCIFFVRNSAKNLVTWPPKLAFIPGPQWHSGL